MKLLSLRPQVLPTTRSKDTLLGPCFKTGQLDPLYWSLGRSRIPASEECQCQGYNTTNNQSHQWLPSSTFQTPKGTQFRQPEAVYCGANRLSISDFRYFLTLSSGVLSPFPHGTCELSVSNYI
ncbi:hypothetical protein GEMRC1_004930 [Eukaryota sp. GEM-RC1]